MQNAIFAARSPGIREHGSLSFGKPLAQLSLVFQGSKDFNPRSATPSDVRGNRRIIISLADHGEAVFAAFSVEWIARYSRTILSGVDCTSWRFSDHASCSGNVPPCWVFSCQGKARCLLRAKIMKNGLNDKTLFLG